MIITLTQQISELNETLADLKSAGVSSCDVAIICGSGLSDIADEFYKPEENFSTASLRHWPITSVEGHYGKWLSYRLKNGKNLAILQGRGHLYEGNTPYRATYPIRILHKLGCKVVIITSACGSLNPDFEPNTIMLHRDFINFTNMNPFNGIEFPLNTSRFPDMTNPYDLTLTNQLADYIKSQQVTVNFGTHVQVLGPTFETKGEVKMLQIVGGDVVSMSSVIEVMVAHALRLKTIGLSLVTNYGTGIATANHCHSNVLNVAKNLSHKIGNAFSQWIDSIEMII